jgi:MoaA/NifB/PqqE/SkfB family radical SAM enzyme
MSAEFPAYIELQTISTCNSRCRICPMEWTASALPQGRMSDALLDRILGEIADHAPVIRSVEPYLNNEPLLDRRFLDVLRRIRAAHECTVEVSTNASRLTPELSATILDERLIDDFRFSVFGASKKTHEAVMVGLDWERVTDAVRTYARLWNERGRSNTARVVFVHNPILHPPGELERVRALWADTGLGLIAWEHLDRAGSNRIRLNSDRLAMREGRVVNCKMGYLRDRVAVLYNGEVQLCCQDWGRAISVGNVADSSLEAVWNSPRRRDLSAQIYGMDDPEPDLLCRCCELATVG